MPVIRGTRKEIILPIDLFWEKHTVTIKGQEGVRDQLESLEILRLAEGEHGGAVAPVAPDHVIGILDLHDARIIGVLELIFAAVLCMEDDTLLGKGEMNTVIALAEIEIRDPVIGLGAKYAREASLKGNESTIEDARHVLNGSSLDDGVSGISPDGSVRRGLLPRDIGEIFTDDFCHSFFCPSFL